MTYVYAVITGASSGFGLAFARTLGKLGYDLCIIARRSKRLYDIKLELEKKHKITVDVLSTDLSLEENMIRAYNFTKNKDVVYII